MMVQGGERRKMSEEPAYQIKEHNMGEDMSALRSNIAEIASVFRSMQGLRQAQEKDNREPVHFSQG